MEGGRKQGEAERSRPMVKSGTSDADRNGSHTCCLPLGKATSWCPRSLFRKLEILVLLLLGSWNDYMTGCVLHAQHRVYKE